MWRLPVSEHHVYQIFECIFTTSCLLQIRRADSMVILNTLPDLMTIWNRPVSSKVLVFWMNVQKPVTNEAEMWKLNHKHIAAMSWVETSTHILTLAWRKCFSENAAGWEIEIGWQKDPERNSMKFFAQCKSSVAVRG
jgi:hypothetical protein